MKKLFFILLVPAFALAQSQDQNYIKNITYKDSTQTNKNIQVIYFDGLGRPIQKIDNAQSNTGKDIITHIEYDDFGRQVKKYLPFPSSQNTMDFIAPLTAQNLTTSHYQGIYGDNNPFNEKFFQDSPLNRVLKQAEPGTAWAMGSGHEIKMSYLTNEGTGANTVNKYNARGYWDSTNKLYNISVSQIGVFSANELYLNIIKNENWTSGNNNTIHEFKDKEGHIILKRSFSDIKDATGNIIETQAKHDTYYLYDQFGNLTYIIPPLANGAVDQNTLDGLCYQYKYDHRNRLVEKKLPGKQWEYIIYDKLDRIVAIGPVLSPFSDTAGANGWLITKYDIFNRPVLTAWYADTINSTQRNLLQNSINGSTVISESKTTTTTNVNSVAFNYTTTAWPTSGYHTLTVNYYDDYLYPHAETLPTTVLGQTVYYNNTQKPKGLATGTWIRVTQSSTISSAETSIIYYDYKARPIRTKTVNYITGYTQVDRQLDFTGKILATETRHKRLNSSPELVTLEEFTYSAQDRLLTHTHQINGGAKQLLIKNTYDELGQLTSKNVGGTDVTGATSLQKVDYKYNIRGWLKEINDISNLTQGTNPKDLFAYKINYNDNETNVNNLNTGEIAVSQLFNGNISETLWVTANDNTTRKYGYEYDNLNRLVSSKFQRFGAQRTYSYDENLTYDKNGNIATLLRNGANLYTYDPPIDNLTYVYDDTTKNSNRLLKVTDNEPNDNGFKDGNTTDNDYDYDANGNMILDKNKGITSITYNHLNLPVKIDLGSNKIEYIYNATGQKIKKTVTEGGIMTRTEYLGGYQYKAGALDFFPHTEGYVKRETTGAYRYVFNYTDHLGNVRVSYSDIDKDGIIDKTKNEILEESNYYSFGLKHEGYNTGSFQPNYAYRMQNKEWQDELGLNWYDFGGRDYMPDIVRTPQIDPLAEKFYDLSPQSFLNNNPLSFIDPTGMGTEDWYKDKNGVMRWDKNVKTQADVDKVSPGGKYVGETHSTKTATYYKNGSAFFKNEFEGYKYMMDNSNMQKGKNEVEYTGYITRKGIAVLPNEGVKFDGTYFKSYSLRSTLNLKGFEQTGYGETLRVKFNGEIIKPIAWIHTHPDSGAGYGQSQGDNINTSRLGVPSIILGRSDVWYNSVKDSKLNLEGTAVMKISDLRSMPIIYNLDLLKK